MVKLRCRRMSRWPEDCTTELSEIDQGPPPPEKLKSGIESKAGGVHKFRIAVF